MTDTRSWADLPLEILNLIRQALPWEDDCNFRATCRGWNFIVVFDPVVYENVKYPFLLRFSKSGNDDDSHSCGKVYSPAYHNKMYHIRAPTQLGDAHIFCSNYGWLLLCDGTQVFFYHPNTERIIKLPECAHVQFDWMSFSAPPTSLDCMVLGFRNSESPEKTGISFIRRGQRYWKHYHDVPNRMNSKNVEMIIRVKPNVRRQRSSKFKWSDSTCSPVFYKGAFYCLARDGRLGVFDPKEKSKHKIWKLLHTKFMDDPQNQAYLVECRGELISIVVAPMGEFIRIFKFHERRQAWRIVHDLKDQMVFLSITGCTAVACDDLQVKRFANTLHFPVLHEDRHIFYSISTERFHSFEHDYTSDDLYDTKLALNQAWVIPTFSIPSTEQRELQLRSTAREDAERYNTHPRYIIRSLSLLPPPSSTAYSSGSNKLQLEAPVADPCLLFYNNEEGGRILLVDLGKEPVTNHSRNAALAERIKNQVVLGISSDYGKLVLVDSYASECCLLDPCSMIETPLPTWEATFTIGNAVLHLPPGDDSKLLVVVFGSTGDQNEDTTLVWQDGDETWTRIETPSKQAIRPRLGAVLHQGKIYGLCPTYDLAVMELQQGRFIFEPMTEVEFPKPDLWGTVCYVCKLVESCDELLLFVRYYQYGCRLEDDLTTTPVDVKVYKMDWELLRWEMLDDLGDRAFFWCRWACYPCCASKSGFQKNSIYFFEERDMNLYVYDYENQTISTSMPCPDIDDWPLGPLCFMWYK